MKIGIVGHEAAKFTPETQNEAMKIIGTIVLLADEVISGECHLGGIDIWARDLADIAGVPFVGFPPASLSWEHGYKPRNIQIAERAEKVICIVVKSLPMGYAGMRFPMCYHCKTDSHVKSGGCWTARYAGKLGKPFEIIEI